MCNCSYVYKKTNQCLWHLHIRPDVGHSSPHRPEGGDQVGLEHLEVKQGDVQAAR